MDTEVKAQPVRLLDVFVIGPLMIWGGYALDREGRHYGGTALAVFGVSTVIYNALNYETIRRREARRRG